MTDFDSGQTNTTSDHDKEQRRKRMATIGAAYPAVEMLSDRDRIAEKAMQAYLLEFGMRDYETIAEWSYKMADAMLAERNRTAAGQNSTA